MTPKETFYATTLLMVLFVVCYAYISYRKIRDIYRERILSYHTYLNNIHKLWIESSKDFPKENVRPAINAMRQTLLTTDDYLTIPRFILGMRYRNEKRFDHLADQEISDMFYDRLDWVSKRINSFNMSKVKLSDNTDRSVINYYLNPDKYKADKS